MAANEIAIYYDASMCSACKGCQINCKQWNQLPSPLDQEEMPYSGSFENPLSNDGDTWLHIKFNEDHMDLEKGHGWAFGRDACLHCTDAACVAACPTGACHKEPNGCVVIDADTCIGCKYCVAACPFEIPKFNEREQVTRKCWMCQDRLADGRKPACVSTCPTGALQFGPRSEMIALARERAAALKPIRPDVVVYGEEEMGGLHVISVLPYGAEAHGLPVDPAPHITTTLSHLIKPAMGVGIVGMLGLVAASFIGGRGYKRGVEDLSYDPEHPELGIVDARDTEPTEEKAAVTERGE